MVTEPKKFWKPFTLHVIKIPALATSPLFDPLDYVSAHQVFFTLYNEYDYIFLALTTRGFMEEDFEKVADLIHESINVTQFICSKLDGGAKAPLKVRKIPAFIARIFETFS